MQLQNYQSTDPGTEIFVSPDRTSCFIPKIIPPCNTCVNISRDQAFCKICLAAPAYADYAEGITEYYVKEKTGPEILTKETKKKETNDEKILRTMKYKTISDLIQDLYYDQGMKYVDMAAYIRAVSGANCNKTWVYNHMKSNNYTARNGKT